MTEITPQEPRDDLSRFLRDARDRGMSYRAIAERGTDPESGEKLTFQYVSDLAAGRVANAPSQPRMRALAAGLGVNSDVIRRLAAAQYLGYEAQDIQPGSDEWLIWAVLPDLDEDKKRYLRTLASELAATQRREHGKTS